MFVILTLFILIIVVLILNKSNNKETFKLPDTLYSNLRNYIDDNYRHNDNLECKKFPFKISSNCYADKYDKCVSFLTQDKKLCENLSLYLCEGPEMISENYL